MIATGEPFLRVAASSNNAFGALAIEDWKGFLRFRLRGDALEVNMLGLDRVPRGPTAQELPRGWRIVDRFVMRKGAGERDTVRATPVRPNQ